ncbi:MAG: putative metal-binding membrane protein, partial [Gammaproteobacteria bacterium]
MPRLPHRDFFSIIGSLTGITLLAWYYLIIMATDMNAMASMPNMPLPLWDFRYFLLMFFMWAIMMIGMMLPSVVPTVLIYASIARKARKDGASIASTGFFVAGYLAMWIVFSLFATCLQWAFDELGLLSPMMMANNALFGATLLILTGIYQCLPIKDACLHQCRSPIEFFRDHWRKGNQGTFLMGMHHGLFCVGCCWVLMGLLFFGGVMSLLWIAAITIFVLLEKVLPFGAIGGKIMGLLMIFSGLG